MVGHLTANFCALLELLAMSAPLAETSLEVRPALEMWKRWHCAGGGKNANSVTGMEDWELDAGAADAAPLGRPGYFFAPSEPHPTSDGAWGSGGSAGGSALGFRGAAARLPVPAGVKEALVCAGSCPAPQQGAGPDPDPAEEGLQGVSMDAVHVGVVGADGAVRGHVDCRGVLVPHGGGGGQRGREPMWAPYGSAGVHVAGLREGDRLVLSVPRGGVGARSHYVLLRS